MKTAAPTRKKADDLKPGNYIEVGTVVSRVEAVIPHDPHDVYATLILTTRHRDGIREWHDVREDDLIRVCPDFAWTNPY